MRTRPTTSRSAAAPGFTLSEVLVAMGILTLGLTIIATIFPTAILLQKEAVDDSQEQINIRSAESILQGKSFDAEVLFKFTEFNSSTENTARAARSGTGNLEFDVYAVAEVDEDVDSTSSTGYPDMQPGSYDSTESYLNNWPEVDRAFPSYVADMSKREFYAVPLFRRGPEGTPYIRDWPVYLFLMKRDINVTGLGYYTNDPSAVPDAGSGTSNLTTCANPFDDADYFPKVFRMEVPSTATTVLGIELNVGANGNFENFPDGSNGLRVRVGDTILADDGEIYRVTGANTQYISINKDERQRMEDDLLGSPKTKIQAIWFAMPPTNASGSPTRDIRVLSSTTVKIIDGLN